MKTPCLITSSNLDDYDLIINSSLITENELGKGLLNSINKWCNIGSKENKQLFWEVYLLHINDVNIGITGLYSLIPNSTNELWLGWFGINDQYRSMQYGNLMLQLTIEKLLNIKCKELILYTNSKNYKAQQMYTKNGFIYKNTVGEEINKHGYDLKTFDNLDDLVFSKQIIND